jgi:DNA primase
VISVAKPAIDVKIAGHSVRASNPDTVSFQARGETKLDLVQYDLAVSEGALPFGEAVPEPRPDRLQTVRVGFPDATGEPKRVAPSRARKATS